jgi:DNA-binding transcriptional MerR regulator
MITTREGLLPIGKFANASRLSPKALRLYDQKGIIAPVYVDPESGYRYYHRDQLVQARLVRLLRQMEMPLAIIQLAVGREPDEVEELVRAYSRTYSARVGRVQSTIRQVLEMLRDKEVAMSFEVEITELDPQQIVSITSHTYVQDLDDCIKTTLSALKAYVSNQGGEHDGAPLGIYHGTITGDADGPIEVCLPVKGKFVPSGDVVVRELPGGPATQVLVTGDRCDFPAILGAYDVAIDWIHKNGCDTAGPPREVWVSKPGEDVKMLIVWPFRERKGSPSQPVEG